MRPHTSYLICATPRSGSFLLCETLKNTGIAGRPEEYFWHGYGDRPPWPPEWGVSNYADFLQRAIAEGTTPNGVFGAKIMWGYFDDFIGRLRDGQEWPAPAPATLLRTVFPNLSYVFLTRLDKVRQAISWVKALQTDTWATTSDDASIPTQEPAYDFTAIDRFVQVIDEHETAWRRFFNEAGVTPLTIVYENLVNTYEETARTVLRYLHILIPEPLVFGERRLQRQADRVSEMWLEQYQRQK